MSQLVDQSLGKPIQGVSQQAESLRAKGQCNEQINFISDPVVGLRRRPPSHHILNIDAYSIYEDYVDADGDKILCISASKVDIFDPALGTITNVTVNNSVALDYLLLNLLSTTRRSVAFVEDSVYISNPAVTVLKDNTYVPPTRFDNLGVVYCLGGQYSREYSVTVTYDDASSTTSTFTTPDGTVGTHYEQIQSTYIVNQLAVVVAGLKSDPQIDLTVYKDHFTITARTGATKTITSITCSDDEGGLALKCAFNSVKAVADLPEYAPVSAVLTVTGLAGSEDDAYFEFKTPNSATTGLASMGISGIWVETVKAGDEFQFDNTVLPVKITKVGGSYELDLVIWKGREIGDSESNETPSIVNKVIKDITNIQGRLGLLSPDTVVFSRTKRPTELWRRSIIGGVQIDDAIDGSGDASTGVHTFFAKNAQDLAVFTKKGQYVILGSTALTPQTIALTPTTYNTSIDTVRPIGVAGNLYYATDNGDFMGVSEYFKEDTNFFSLPISGQVSRYMLGTAKQFKGSNPQSMLALQTDDSDKVLYCYKFLFSGKKRIQSAWFKFEFNNNIKHYSFSSNSMIIITETVNGHVVERIDFDSIVTGGLSFEVHLDRSKTYTLDVNNEISPLDIHKEADVVFVSLNSTASGLPVEWEVSGANYKMLSGTTGDTVIAGYRYTSTYSPTAPRVFDKDNEVIQVGDLNVHNLLVNVTDSGVFTWTITSDYGTTTTEEVSNRVWNDANNLIGSEPLFTKQWTIPWRGKASRKACTIATDKHTPLNISYFEFKGDLRRTTKRI